MKSLKTVVWLILLVIIFAADFSLFAQNFKSEEDLKKQAEKLFKEEKYEEALPLYSQLLSLYQKDPDYNYKYGTCLLYASEDKEKPLMYLAFAANKPNVDNDVFFHLGRALQLNYRFDEAIINYQNFKKNASAKSIASSHVDMYIENCKHGKELLSHITKLQVLEKKDLKLEDFYMSYDLSDLGGKLVVKPEDFLSPIDIKKNDRSLIYLLPGSQEYYFSSYGESEKNSRDIYKVVKLPNGEFSKPINLGPIINTSYDEDYPFIHPNGRTLYFCSKGHNSMGGYDIFKSEWDANTSTWSKPVNLDFAINSPDDDFMFITNKDNTLAYFASRRNSIVGRTHIYKIKLEEQKEEIILVSGKLQLPPGKDLSANIQVRDLNAKRKIIGVYHTNAKTGQYVLSVPNGGNVEITVEVPRYATLTRSFEVPKIDDFTRTLKQEITQNPNDETSLMLINRFDEKVSEEDRNFALSFIKQSASLDVNIDSALEEINKNIEEKESAKDTVATAYQKEDNPPVNNETPISNQALTSKEQPSKNKDSEQNTSNKNNSVPEKGLTEVALYNMAYEEAKETEQEAKEIKNDALLDRQIADKKKQNLAQNQQLLQEANQKLQNAKDEDERRKAQELINELQTKEVQLQKQIEVAENIAQKLEQAAAKKQMEAEADLKYANDLETAIRSKSDVTALAKLAEQRKQLEDSQPDYSLDVQYEDAKEALKTKQDEIQNNTKQIAQLTNEIKELETEKNNLIAEQGKTKDKTIKQTLSNQIAEIENQQQKKRNETITYENKNKLLKLELDSLNKQFDLVSDLVAEIKGQSLETDQTAKANDINSTNQLTENTPLLTEIPFNSTITAEVKNELSKKSYMIKANNELNKNKLTTDSVVKEQNNIKINNDLKRAIETDLQLIEANNQQLSDKAEKEKNEQLIIELSSLKSKAEASIAQSEKRIEELSKTTVSVNENSNLIEAKNQANIQAFNTQLQQAQAITDPVKHEERLIEINKNQIEYLSQESDALKKQLSTTSNANEKEQIQEKIKDIAIEINERKLAVKQSEENLQKLKGTTAQDLALNTASTNTTSNQQKLEEKTSDKNSTATQTSANNIFDTNQNKAVGIFPEGSTYNSISYTSQSAAQVLMLYSSGQTKLDKLNNEIDSLRSLQANTADEQAKISIQQELEQKVKKAQEVNVLLAEILGEANKRQIEEQQRVLTQIQKQNSAENDKATMATLLTEESDYFYKEARLLREQAKNTNDVAEKERLSSRAYELEKRAIDKQIRAYGLYNGQLTVLASENNPNQSQAEPIATSTDTEKTNELSNTNKITNPDTLKEVALNSNELIETNKYSASNTGIANTQTVSKQPIADNVSPSNNTLATTGTNKPVENVESVNISVSNETEKLMASFTPAQKQAVIDSVKLTPEYKELSAIKNEVTIKQEKTEMVKADYSSSINKYNEQLKKLNKIKEDLNSANDAEKTSLEEVYNKEQQRADSLRKIMQERRMVYDTHKAEYIAEKEKLQAALTKYPADKRPYLELALIGNVEDAQELAQNNTTNNPAETTVATSNNNKLAPPIEGQEKTPDVQNIGPAKETANTTVTNHSITEVALKNKSASEPTSKNSVSTTSSGSVNASVIKVTTPTKVEIKNNRIVLPKTFEEVDAFFEETKVSAYSETNPIPIDVVLPEGLIFKVQIGAFRNPIPQDLFKNFNPVTGERTSTGIVRYTVGFFKKFGFADQAKREIQAMGYPDAFVVAFYNGKRISINEALAMSKEQAISSISQTNNQKNTNALSDNISNLNTTNSQTVNNQTNENILANSVNDNAISVSPKTGVKDLNASIGLIYTVQVGVYRNPVTSAQLYNVSPLYTEVLPNGLIRYTSGLYKTEPEAITAKNKIVVRGISDAFVVAFKDGKRIPLSQARALQSGGQSSFVTESNSNLSKQLKVEDKQPFNQKGIKRDSVIRNVSDTVNTNKVVVIPETEKPLLPVVPNLKKEENAVKKIENIPDTGIVYKVQIGAFRYEVPNDIAVVYLKISSKAVVENYTDQEGLTHYTFGKVRTYAEANELKQLVIQEGIEKPFVVAFNNGKKIDVEEAKKITDIK